jgi:hypothetical protein
MTLRL